MGTGWDQQDAPPARGGRVGQTAANYQDPVSEAELAQYDQAWRDAELREPGAGGYTRKPDGTYVAEIVGARMTRTKAQGTPMFELVMSIVAGPAGGTHTHWRILRDADSARYLRQDLHNIGVDPPLLSQLEQFLPGLEGLYVEFVLKTAPGKGGDGKTYQNTYVNRALTSQDELDAAIEAAKAASDPVPF